MSNSVQQIHIRLNSDTYEQVKNIAYKNGVSINDLVRNFIDVGLKEKVVEENTDLIAQIVRKQMEIVIKPHIERLARISSKAGHMAATSTFLNAQALVDLVPEERRRDVKVQYSNARKQAVEFMRRKTTEYENEFD